MTLSLKVEKHPVFREIFFMKKKISPTNTISILHEVADAESSGDYSRAFQLLSVFWNNFKVNPVYITELPSDIVAEVFLRCGSIAGYLGH